MPFAYTTVFSLIEWLAITGFGQSLLILIYIVSRVRNWRQATLATSYFVMLGAAFALQFSLRLEEFEENIRYMMWFAWAMGPPLCYLLVLQIAKLTDIPPARHFWVLALVPLAMLLSLVVKEAVTVCERVETFYSIAMECTPFDNMKWLYWLGGMAGTVSMLSLWMHKGLFNDLWREKGGHERYWLILTMIVTNVVAIMIDFLRSTESISPDNADAAFIILGMAFLYLASTTLFRVYPPPMQLVVSPRPKPEDLSLEEKSIADKISQLMELDKVYQEPTFSRADLAREMNISESILSKVINVAFGKSFPKLINEFRVEDAKRMLLDSAIPVQVIATESGFNSLASFNRVFREMAGETPSSYRSKNMAK